MPIKQVLEKYAQNNKSVNELKESKDPKPVVKKKYIFEE